MGVATFKARVVDNLSLASKFQYVDLELVEPKRISFKAGQYVMVKIPGSEQVRSYSIASAPSMDHGVELLVDVSPQGEGSLYLASLKPGDEVGFMGPAGVFSVAQDKVEEELLFVATGSGIAPLRSMIIDLLIDKRDKRKMWLHWGLRYAEDIFWFDDFAQMAEEYDNFYFDLVLSKPPESWELCRGRVTDCVLTHHAQEQSDQADFSKVGVYLCGGREMVEEMTGKLKEQGVEKVRIHKEKYY